MEKQIFEILKEFEKGNITIIEAHQKICDLCIVGVMFKDKEEKEFKDWLNKNCKEVKRDNLFLYKGTVHSEGQLFGTYTRLNKVKP